MSNCARRRPSDAAKTSARRCPADDLVLRAARALQAVRAARPGRAHRHRQAHSGAGRHGRRLVGRRDLPAGAATGCGACDCRWPQLEQIGLALGADVPFFLRGRNAWVEGIGEQHHAAALPPARFVVVKPAAGLDTRAHLCGARAATRHTDAAIISGFAADDALGLGYCLEFGHNDLQPVAQRLCPRGAPGHRMAGCPGLQGTDDRLGKCGFRADCRTTQTAAATPPRAGRCASAAIWPCIPWWVGRPSDRSSVDGRSPKVTAVNPCRGVAKLVKALDFDSSMRRFESFLPCQISVPTNQAHFLQTNIAGTRHAGSAP